MNAAVKPMPVTFPEAFLKLQAGIKPAIKDANNPAFRSKYADLGAVWEAIKQPLQDAGFSVIQSPDFEGQEMWLKTTILHVSGERMEGRYPIRPLKQDPQGFGSAMTYARRYSLSAMLGVISEEDDDGNSASNRGSTPPPPKTPAPVTDDQSEQDKEILEGAKNWSDKQKGIIAAAGRLPDLLMWLDEHGGDWAKPHSPSTLDRLKRKAPEVFTDLKAFYMQAQSTISQKKDTK